MNMMTIENLTKLHDTAPNQKLKRQYAMMLDKLIAKQQRSSEQLIIEQESSVKPVEATLDKSVEEERTKPSEAIFQAIGCISGQVSLTEDDKLTIDIRGNQFDLRYIPGRSGCN